MIWTESDPYFSVDDEDERDPLCDETWLGYSKINDQWELATKDVTVGANGECTKRWQHSPTAQVLT